MDADTFNTLTHRIKFYYRYKKNWNFISYEWKKISIGFIYISNVPPLGNIQVALQRI